MFETKKLFNISINRCPNLKNNIFNHISDDYVDGTSLGWTYKGNITIPKHFTSLVSLAGLTSVRGKILIEKTNPSSLKGLERLRVVGSIVIYKK